MGMGILICIGLMLSALLAPVRAATSQPAVPGARLNPHPGAAEALPGLERRPSKGVFLVAGRNLLDPNFYRSVVLLTAYGPEGAMGLVVNQPTQIKLSEVFPDAEAFRKSGKVLYRGGPVAAPRILMLFRTPSPPDSGAERVFDHVYMSASRSLLDTLIRGTKVRFRLYGGHAGWAPGQLDMEIARGAWHVVPADADLVFAPAPSEIWQRLMDRMMLRSVRTERGRIIRTAGRAGLRPHHSARNNARSPGRLGRPGGACVTALGDFTRLSRARARPDPGTAGGHGTGPAWRYAPEPD